MELDIIHNELMLIIKSLTDEQIKEISIEIYTYQKTGALPNEALIKEISDKFKIDLKTIEYYVFKELSDRYKIIVFLLLENRIRDFIINL